MTAKDTVSVTDKDGKVIEIKAKNIIVATGATATVPPAWKMDGQKVVTYLEAILQEKLPKSVVIIGAGAIGMEFATIWNGYGVDVTVVEMLPHVLPLEDEEAASEVAKAFTKRGVKLLAGYKVESVGTTKTGVKVTVSAAGDASTSPAAPLSTKVLEAEQALVAIGFRPNSKGLGLEEVGVKISERGSI